MTVSRVTVYRPALTTFRSCPYSVRRVSDHVASTESGFSGSGMKKSSNHHLRSDTSRSTCGKGGVSTTSTRPDDPKRRTNGAPTASSVIGSLNHPSGSVVSRICGASVREHQDGLSVVRHGDHPLAFRPCRRPDFCDPLPIAKRIAFWLRVREGLSRGRCCASEQQKRRQDKAHQTRRP